jgi:N-acetylglutamate synthase-like GNAT family acetyltransferase
MTQPDPDWQLSTDPAWLQLDLVHRWLAASYWSPSIRFEVVERAFANSHVIGAYDARRQQIGVARLLTDCATFAWLCDVHVVDAQRKRGIATAMVKVLMADPRVATVRRFCLATRDAHTLYTPLGFSAVPPDRWMEYRPPEKNWQSAGE